MEDRVRRVLVVLSKGLPDTVEFPIIPPDHILHHRIRLSRIVLAALVVLAQEQIVITLDQLLGFLRELEREIKEHPEEWLTVGIAA